MLRPKLQNHIFYKINLKSLLHFKDVNLVENSTEYLWEYHVLEIKEDRDIVVELTIKETKSTNAHDTEDATRFARMLNIPFERLNLLLDYEGTPIKVINQKEIFNKWQLIKTKFTDFEKENLEFRKIINCGDIDYKYSLSKINSSLLYFLFFSPVYYTQNTIKRRLEYPSIVNSGEVLINKVIQKLSIVNSEQHIFDLSCEHSDYGVSNLKKRYKKELSNYIKAPFEYYFKFNTTGVYDSCTGLLKSSLTNIREQASEEFYYISDIDIQQIQKKSL